MKSQTASRPLSQHNRLTPHEGSEYTLEMDVVIMSIGTNANPLLPRSTPGLELNKWGYIIAEEPSGKTSVPGVYAGGDIVTGSATVILAMGAGRDAAIAIDKYLNNK